MLAEATPAELAAVEGFLAGEPLPNLRPAAAERDCKSCFAGLKAVLARMERKLDAVQKAQKAVGLVEREEAMDDDELREVYGRVLTLSNSESSEREVSLKEVFDCYCGKGLSASKTAAALGCSKATVMSRLAELKTISGVPACKLRTYQPLFEGIEKSLREPRARRACGKQAALGDESDAAGQGGSS
jgi:hypothetical protein